MKELRIKRRMNKCPNKLKCLTQDKTLTPYSVCIKGQRVKLTLYKPKSKATHIRCRIVGTAGARAIVVDHVKVNKKHWSKSRLTLRLKDVRFIEYPMLCEEGIKQYKTFCFTKRGKGFGGYT